MSYLKLKDLTIHPLLERALPPITDKRYRELKESIDRNGYNKSKPIEVWANCKEYPNCIVDGHNRYRICMELGKEPEIVESSYSDFEFAKHAALLSATGREMDASQRAQHQVDLEMSQQKVDALNRKRTKSKEKSISELDLPIDHASANIDEDKPTGRVLDIIADHANVGKDTVGFIRRVQVKLEDCPELANEIQDMIREGDLPAKTAGEFVTYDLDVIKDVIKGGAGEVKSFVYQQRSKARKEKKQKEENSKKLEEYKESQKELRAAHDAKKEQLKREYGDDFESMGRVCVINRGNTFEQWCDDCKNGFDAFIGTEPKHGKYHCPYCGETNTRERNPDWTPGNVGGD